MIISKTPFRISFFGGGTDYPVWFEEHGGAVLSTTIDKYCYISIRYLPPFFTHKHRIVYSNIENVKSIDEIQHPSVKALLRQFNIEKGLEIHHDGDLPARSGLGSSSAFTVGMLNALYALKGRIISKYELAKQAIDVERNVLKEIVGSQDQVAVACGGFNKITFNKDHTFRTEPMTLQKERIIELEQHLMLIFTGFSRFASEIAAEQIKNTMDRKKELSSMKEMVDHAIEILNSCQDIAEFGKLLHESWQLKKCLSNK
ncbi:MAG: kinase, partial [Candidatus Omnitrophica bacterium CG_4_10_14_0_2_um_filter_44_9]